MMLKYRNIHYCIKSNGDYKIIFPDQSSIVCVSYEEMIETIDDYLSDRCHTQENDLEYKNNKFLELVAKFFSQASKKGLSFYKIAGTYLDESNGQGMYIVNSTHCIVNIEQDIRDFYKTLTKFERNLLELNDSYDDVKQATYLRVKKSY